MRKALLFLASLLLAVPTSAQNFVTVTAASIRNGDSTLLSSGNIIFQAVDASGNPISYQAGGGGQQTTFPTVCTVTNGVIQSIPACLVANSALTNPTNVCFSVTVKNSNNVIVLGGAGSGYDCVQPVTLSYWCSAGSCDFDMYVPNINGVPIAVLPPPTTLSLGGVYQATCPGSEFQNGTLSTGQPSCSTPSGSGTITGVVAGAGLSGGGVSGSVTLSMLTTCSSGQILAWNGTTWACAANGGAIYPPAGIPQSNGTAWGASYGTSGSGNVALTTSPSFTTPSLGAASAASVTSTGPVQASQLIATGMTGGNGPVYVGSVAAMNLIAEPQAVDAGEYSNVTGNVSDSIWKKINYIIANAPTSGVLINATGWSSGALGLINASDMFDAAGTLNTDKPVDIFFPPVQIVLCQPDITPHPHIHMWPTFNTNGTLAIGTVWIAGNNALGCAGNFPNGGADLPWTYPHPPLPAGGGSGPGGAYLALVIEGGQGNAAASQSLNFNQNVFGHVWEDGFTFDCNSLCDIPMYIVNDQEHTRIISPIVRNYFAIGIFGDRLGNNVPSGTLGGSPAQAGPGNWEVFGVQGPAVPHVSCTLPQVQMWSGSAWVCGTPATPYQASIPYKLVFMGSNTTIDIEGGSCTPLADGESAWAYTKTISGGGLAAPVLTNGGSNCSGTPSCSVHNPGSNPNTPATCSVTMGTGSPIPTTQVASVQWTNVPAGYWVGSTLVTGPAVHSGWGIGGSSLIFNWDTVIGGTTQTTIDHPQCQGVYSGCLLFGYPTAPNDGGSIVGPNVANQYSSYSSAVDIGKGSDGLADISNACQQDPISSARNIVIDETANLGAGYFLTTGPNGTPPFCISHYTQQLMLPNTSATGTAPIQFNNGGISGGTSGLVNFLATGPSGSVSVMGIKSLGPVLPNNLAFLFSSTNSLGGNPDTGIARPQAGIVSADTGNGGTPGNGLGGLLATQGVSEVWSGDNTSAHPLLASLVINNGSGAVRNAQTSSTTGVIGVCTAHCNTTGILAATVASQGSGGYANNDVVTVAGGSGGTLILTVVSGSVTALTPSSSSDGTDYTVSTQSTSGGTGSGLTVNVTVIGGSATIQESGQVSASFDGSTTAGDFVQVSGSSAGKVTDAGSTCPASNQVLGQVLGTNSGAGTYKMELRAGMCR